jgi:hypothetical protein
MKTTLCVPSQQWMTPRTCECHPVNFSCSVFHSEIVTGPKNETKEKSPLYAMIVT